jgi:hypothetical protein
MIIGFTGDKGVGKKTAGCVFDTIESTSLLYKFSFGNQLSAACLLFEDDNPRNKYPGYFVHRMEMNLKRVVEGDIALICDVANEDEALCIKKSGGIIIEIIRNNSVPVVYQHMIDFTIENNGTIDELHSKLLDIFS